MKRPYRKHAGFVQRLTFGFFLLLGISGWSSQAQAVMPITPSGLNTTVSAPITLPSGQTQFDITGGTRPGGGANLFHSFGDFNVPNNNIANFLNNSGLPTSNILGRVTGGNVSDIFGTIQTTGFGNANLFLMNPAGFLFGPNATVNVGGMMTFTSADYLRLADNARFNAVPHTAPDLLLSAAPVAAFGFLGSNPGAITVQGSQLTVAEGTGISLVGGNITVQGGTFTAPSGNITLVSVGRPSHPHVGGEVVVAGSGQGSGFIPVGFKSLGAITLSQGSTIDTSATPSSGQAAGGVLIRGGRFVMDASSIQAVAITQNHTGNTAGNIEVTAEQVAFSNHSSIDASVSGSNIDGVGSAGHITFNVGTFSATDSAIDASSNADGARGGPVTIRGLQGSGASAHSVSLTNTTVSTFTSGFRNGSFNVEGGPILIRAGHIALNQSSLSALTFRDLGGTITLVSRGGLEIQNSSLSTRGAGTDSQGGTVDLQAGAGIDLTDTIIDAHAFQILPGGTITMAAPVISIRGSQLDVSSGGLGHGGTISITGSKAVSLTNGTVLTADNAMSPEGGSPSSAIGGTILIDGGAQFTSQQSTISAGSAVSNGGTIHVEANKVSLTDTQLTTSVSGGPQTVAGSITVDAKNVKLINSEILSTATEGHGGTIGITTHKLNSTNSVTDAKSQSGTNGTVTINGVIQP